jgi:hypothetical protein
METFAPVTLKQKPLSEVWQIRQRVNSELQAMYDSAEGRALTADEKALEDRAVANMKAIDAVIGEAIQTQAFDRYSGVGSQQVSARDQAAVDWLKSAIVEKNPSAFTTRLSQF